MLLSLLLPALFITIAHAAPTPYNGEEISSESDGLLASTDIPSSNLDAYFTGTTTTTEENDYEAEPIEIAGGTSTRPPQGFQYASSPYDGYCLPGYTDCKICVQSENACFPAVRKSYADGGGRTAWKLCESDVPTPPCTDYNPDNVFTRKQLDAGQ